MEAVLSNRVAAAATVGTAATIGPSLAYPERPVQGFAGWRSRSLPRIRSARVGGEKGTKLDSNSNNTDNNNNNNNNNNLLLQAALKPNKTMTTNWLQFFFNRPESRLSPQNESQPQPQSETETGSCFPCPSSDLRGAAAEVGGDELPERKLWKSPRFTAEKARILRTQMRASETWHDAMYHSSIASKLATTHHPPP